MKISPLIIFSAACLVAGCSFAPVGENTFDCNRKSNPSDYCRSFKSLEKSTNDNLPESRFDKEFHMSDYDKANGIAPNDASENNGSSHQTLGMLPHNQAGFASSTAGVDAMQDIPVRKTPVIQRVWIKRFVDENDMLQGDTIVYKEVQSSKWSGFEGANNSGFAAGAVLPHRSAISPNASSASNVESRQVPSSRQDNAPFSQPPAGDDENGMQPPVSGSNMPQ